MNSHSSISILGCGWLGLPLAQSLVQKGQHVLGATTQPAKLKRLRAAGIEPVLLRLEPEGVDENQDFTQSPFFSSHQLLLNIPPSTPLGPEYHLGQIEALLRRLEGKSLRHLLYVSSLSAYGPVQGDINEDTPSLSGDPSGDILQAAEARLTEAAQKMGFALTVVRPGGLVGHGRHPGLFLAGRKGVRDPEHPVNLIHQTDLIELLSRLLIPPAPRPGLSRLFNAVAPSHPTRRQLYVAASLQLEVPPPEFKEPTAEDLISTPAGKTVSSRKIIEETGYEFRVSDWMAALKGGPL